MKSGFDSFFARQSGTIVYNHAGDRGSALFRGLVRWTGFARRADGWRCAHCLVKRVDFTSKLSGCALGFAVSVAAFGGTSATGWAASPDYGGPAVSKSPGNLRSTPAQDVPKFDWVPAVIEFGAESIVIKRPRFEIEMPSDNPSGTAGAAPEMIYAILKPAFEALDRVAVNRVEITGGTVNVRYGDKPAHQLTELTASFAMHPAAGLTTGNGSFMLRGEKIEFDTAFAKPDPDTQTGDIPLRIKISGAGLTASFEGQVRHFKSARLDGKVDVTVTDLRKLVTWSGFSLSDGAGLNTLRTRGTMAWTAGLLSMSEALFTLDGNEAQGVLSLDLRKERASLQGTLAIEQLDLSGYFPTAKSAENTTVLGTLAPALVTTTEISAPILRDFDADVRISVNEIRAHGFRTGTGAMALTLRSGKLLADVAELQLFDGTAVGQLEFNANEHVVTISARGLLDNIEAGDAMSWITSAKPIRGRARVTVNLSGAGRTIGTLLRTMTGDARLKMVDGGAFRIDIDGLMEKAGEKPLIGWIEAGDRETRFGSLEARLLLDNARISTRRLRVDRDDTSIVGYGTINLTAQEVSVRMSVIDKLADGATTAEVYQPGPTLTMKGPWDEPLISVEKQTGTALPFPLKNGTFFANSSAN